MSEINFHDLCTNGHIEIVRSMIKKNLITNYSNALYTACKIGHIGIIQLMIETGKLKNDDYNIGLYGACHSGNIEIIQLMIEKGANKYNSGLCHGCLYGNIKSVRLMIEKGANNYNDGLHDSCINENTQLIQLLIEKGATEIHLWCSFPKNKNIIQTLLSNSLSLKTFKKIQGYEILIKIIKTRENYVINIMNKNLCSNINKYLFKQYIQNDF